MENQRTNRREQIIAFMKSMDGYWDDDGFFEEKETTPGGPKSNPVSSEDITSEETIVDSKNPVSEEVWEQTDTEPEPEFFGTVIFMEGALEEESSSTEVDSEETREIVQPNNLKHSNLRHNSKNKERLNQYSLEKYEKMLYFLKNARDFFRLKKEQMKRFFIVLSVILIIMSQYEPVASSLENIETSYIANEANAETPSIANEANAETPSIAQNETQEANSQTSEKTINLENSVLSTVSVKKGLNLRPDASTDSAPILTIKNGTEIEIFPFDDSEEGWVKARIDESIGYVSKRYISSLSPAEEDDYVAYTNKTTYIKSSDGEIVKNLPKNSRVVVTEDGIRKKVVFWDETGIYAGYLENSDINSFKIADVSGNSEYENVLIFDISYCQRNKFNTVQETEKFLINTSQNENFGGVIIKVAYRGAIITSNIKEDKMYQIYSQAAENVGCPFGVYFWTEATNEKTAEEEIKKFSELVTNLKEKCHWFKLPVCIDSENYFLGVNVNKWRAKAPATIKVVEGLQEKLGEEVLLYTCRALYNKHFSDFNGKVWIAHYDITSKLQSSNFYTDYRKWNQKGEVVLWQFTSKYGKNKIDANSVRKSTYMEWIK